jgi:hypothetical protein
MERTVFSSMTVSTATHPFLASGDIVGSLREERVELTDRKHF